MMDVRKQITDRLRRNRMAIVRDMEILARLPEPRHAVWTPERRKKMSDLMKARLAAKRNGGSMLEKFMDAWNAAVRNHYEARDGERRL
jgi:hypothetical protein